MDENNQGKKSISVKLTEEAKANITEFASELGVDFACAGNLMIIGGLMRLGQYETEDAYLKAIREVEERYSVKVEAKMPRYVQGGDEEYRKNLEEQINQNREPVPVDGVKKEQP